MLCQDEQAKRAVQFLGSCLRYHWFLSFTSIALQGHKTLSADRMEAQMLQTFWERADSVNISSIPKLVEQQYHSTCLLKCLARKSHFIYQVARLKTPDFILLVPCMKSDILYICGSARFADHDVWCFAFCLELHLFQNDACRCWNIYTDWACILPLLPAPRHTDYCSISKRASNSFWCLTMLREADALQPDKL